VSSLVVFLAFEAPAGLTGKLISAPTTIGAVGMPHGSPNCRIPPGIRCGVLIRTLCASGGEHAMTLRIGVVGCGLIGKRRAAVARETGDRVVIVADIDAARAQQVAKDNGCAMVCRLA